MGAEHDEKPKTKLARAVERIRQRERLTPTQVAEQAGMARATYYKALEGRISRPDTLAMIARGLATDPYNGRVDEARRTAYHAELFVAAGYPVPVPAGVTGPATVGLAALGAGAEDLARLLALVPEMSDAEREEFVDGVRLLRARIAARRAE